mgnify:CR=1 FL=1
MARSTHSQTNKLQGTVATGMHFPTGGCRALSVLCPRLCQPAEQRGANRLLQCFIEWHCPHVPANLHRRMPMCAHVEGGSEFEVYFPKE